MNKQNILIFSLSAILFFSLSFIAYSWSEPTTNMPSGYTAPLNTSSNDQTKIGAITVPMVYDYNNTSYYVDPSQYSFLSSVLRTNTRADSSERYPLGHYSSGDTVFEIDPTWSQVELQKYFNSNNVSWENDASAPGGYSIYVNGAVSVGGAYNSGFPYIPVEAGDIFYMEVWIKNVGTGQTHYMGSMDYDNTFNLLGGNPGSYGYWVMAGSNPGSSWVKKSGYISGFGTATGTFKVGTKYWTPMALLNYGAGTGTRACMLSGWKIIKVSSSGNRTFNGNVSVSGNVTGATPTSSNHLATKGYVDSKGGISSQQILICSGIATGSGAKGCTTENCPSGYIRTGCSCYYDGYNPGGCGARPNGNNGCSVQCHYCGGADLYGVVYCVK